MDAELWTRAVVGFCLLQTAAAFLLQPNFDKEKFCGTWYNTGIVLDAGQLSDSDSYEISVQCSQNGMSFSEADAAKNCEKVETVLKVAGRPGKFERDTGSGTNIIRVASTDYNNYGILATDTGALRALHLYTRATEASQEVKQKFSELASCLHFSTNKIVEPQVKECVPS